MNKRQNSLNVLNYCTKKIDKNFVLKFSPESKSQFTCEKMGQS